MVFLVLLFVPFVPMPLLCLGANILAVLPFPGLSHFAMFKPILKELASRGHYVDVVSHFPLETPINRYTDISIAGSLPIFTNNMTVGWIREFKGIQHRNRLLDICGTSICKGSFKATEMQDLKESTKKYDLVITELFATDCMLGWAWHFGAPSVVISTGYQMPWDVDRFGLPDNPAYIPNYFLGFDTYMSLYERIVNTWALIQTKISYRIYSNGLSNRMAKEFFGENIPNLDDLAYNTSLQLSNTHFSINYARPLVSNVVEIAGIHIYKTKPLNKHLDTLLSTNKNGVICFTMGSVIPSESFPEEKIQAIFDAFSELPYQVIWKANKLNFPKGLKIPENIYFMSWIPQLDLLCDPRVKLIVSHGGLMGTQEAIYCSVPMLGIPLFSDQFLNVKHIEAKGSAIMIDYDSISKNIILTAAKKLLFNTTYMTNAKLLAEEFKDRPMTAMDTAIYWIEYVIRHKGAPRLQSAAKYLAWYQYYLLDVLAVAVGLSCSLVYVLSKLVKVFFETKSMSNKKTKTI